MYYSLNSSRSTSSASKSLDNIDMSEFDAPPPNTHAGGNDNALRTKGNDPMTAPVEYADERINMEEYERTVPLWKRAWQHSLTQLLLLSVQAFCGPAMADAIAGSYSIHSSVYHTLICSRSWRWRSCHASNFKHRNRDQLQYACTMLCTRRSHCQQARHKMVTGHRRLLVSHPRIIILLQQQVRQPVVPDPRWLLHWYWDRNMVRSREWNDNVAGTVELSWQVLSSVDSCA